MTDAAVFRLIHNDQVVAEAVLDGPMGEAVQATLKESQRLSLEVEPKEPDTLYRLRIGDLVPAHEFGTAFRRHVEWPGHLYLDSLRGLVPIRLESRPEAGGEDAWRTRARLLVAAVSSKITEAAFEAMVSDLAALSTGLLFDLVSGAFTGLARGTGSGGIISARSAQLELRVLEELVGDLAGTLLAIARQPEVTLHPTRVIAPWTGTERLSNDGIDWFAARGVDPRAPTERGTALAPRIVTVTETACAEHRIIRWFLELLRERARDCARRANAERAVVAADKPFRSRRFDDEPSLFELFDQPKLDRLNQAIERARRIDRRLREMLGLPFLDGQRPLAPTAVTPVFRYVLHYHRFWGAMREYLRRSTLTLENSLEERGKPMWRMYEQWVFLQLAAALEAAGLRPRSHESLFRRLGAQRFTVDLRRGTQLSFAAPDGRMVRIRYEPWIFSQDLARRHGDTVFHGREGQAPWSPDVLIEVFPPPRRGLVPVPALAIAIDAKYTRRVAEHHWQQTAKYQMIRATATGEPIVRQVWVATPAAPDGFAEIIFQDSAVHWTDAGPDRPMEGGEFLQGAVALSPERAAADGNVRPGTARFVSGLLAWLGMAKEAVREAA